MNSWSLFDADDLGTLVKMNSCILGILVNNNQTHIIRNLGESYLRLQKYLNF